MLAFSQVRFTALVDSQLLGRVAILIANCAIVRRKFAHLKANETELLKEREPRNTEAENTTDTPSRLPLKIARPSDPCKQTLLKAFYKLHSNASTLEEESL